MKHKGLLLGLGLATLLTLGYRDGNNGINSLSNTSLSNTSHTSSGLHRKYPKSKIVDSLETHLNLLSFKVSDIGDTSTVNGSEAYEIASLYEDLGKTGLELTESADVSEEYRIARSIDSAVKYNLSLPFLIKAYSHYKQAGDHDMAVDINRRILNNNFYYLQGMVGWLERALDYCKNESNPNNFKKNLNK